MKCTILPRNQMTDMINRLLGSSFNFTVMELSKYMSYSLLRNDRLSSFKGGAGEKFFHSLGEITRTNECDADVSEIYTKFWFAYLFKNGSLHFNCSQSGQKCSSGIDSQCFETADTNDKSCQLLTVSQPPCRDADQSRAFRFQPCCRFVQSFSKDFSASLKMMKYSVQATHFQESAEEEARVFGDISAAFQTSPYILKPSSSLTRRNFNNLIPLCQGLFICYVV